MDLSSWFNKKCLDSLWAFVSNKFQSLFKISDEQPLDKACHVKDANQEDGVLVGEHGEDEMDMESEKEEEKPKAGGAFSNALSSLNVLRPGVCQPSG